MLTLLSVHVTNVLFLVRFNNFTLTMGFYCNYTLLSTVHFTCNQSRCAYSQCMLVCISMTFEPTGNMCALLLVGVARTFGTVGHVQQSDGKPYIERVPGSE